MSKEQRAVESVSESAPLPVLTVEFFCLELPLYAPVEVSDRSLLAKLRGGAPQFDAHCTSCGKPSTFRSTRSLTAVRSGTIRESDWMVQPGFFSLEVSCSRNALHKYLYCFHYDGNNRLLKYGQLPSLEDIAGADIRKYAKVMPKGYYSELKRATGLASHGIGIGAFVYLRRIFERLIEDHHAALVAAGEAVEGFDGMRMDEKITALKAVLPPALVQHRASYGILSKGIHELDEETCQRYFPVVRQAIITILEQDLRKREEAEEAKKLTDAIAAIAGELKTSKGSDAA